MRKCILFILITLFLFSYLPALTANASFDTKIDFKSESLLLLSMDDGSVIIEKNANEKRSPAGLVGIAVAISAIENCDDLEEYATVESGVLNELAGSGTMGISLKKDEKIKVIDLLYAVMLSSASDAAVVLANHISGSTEAFVDLMNKTAKKAGCTNTEFANVIGVDDDNQYTTAEDIGKLSLYALENPSFDKISKSVNHKIEATDQSNERTIYTSNLMLLIGYTSYYNSNIKGLRTGSTTKAGRCVVTTASKDGYSYLAIVMGAPLTGEQNLAFIECNKMIRWTFEHIKLRVIAEPYKTVAEVKVKASTTSDHVRLVPEKEVSRLVPDGITSEEVLIQAIPEKTKTEITAPVKKGEVLGEAQILYAGREIARINLVAAEDRSRSSSKLIGGFVKNVVSSPIFIIIAVVFIGAAAFYLIQGFLRDSKKKKVRLVKGNRSEAERRMKQKQRRGHGDDEPPKSILR